LHVIELLTHAFSLGIVFNDGKDHTAQRRFIIQHLKNLGLGKSIMADYILDELADIQKTVESHGGKPLSTHHMFNIASFNILWRIITGGSRFAHDDPQMSNLMAVLSRFIQRNKNLTFTFHFYYHPMNLLSGYRVTK